MYAADNRQHRRSILRRLRRAQDGFTMVMAVGFTAVLGLAATTAVTYTTQNQQSAGRQKADRAALSLAEAALARAYSTLYAANDPTMPGAVPVRTFTVADGTGTYQGALDTATNVWTLTGTGRVRNASLAADIVRTATGRASVGSSTRGSGNNAVWNYVYADDTSSCTTVGNSSEVNVPFYVKGNLCLQNQAYVSSYALQVGGTLTITNSATVGLSSTPLHETHIGGGCRLNGGALHNPCTSADRVYASTLDNQPLVLTKPPIELDTWYAEAMPGPMHACTSSSTTGVQFDNDGIMNRSNGTFNLTPTTPYDCRVYDAAGVLQGQITWTPGEPGSLVIHGTIFFDGDISMGQYSLAVYSGRATIYASGRITIGQQSSLCGVVNCTAEWVPTQNLLAFVAGSSTDDTSFEISNFSSFQGAVYAVNDYREGNNSTVWGPIIADQIYLQNSTMNHYVPIGTLLDGMPATYEESVSIVNQAGSWG
jgi:Tfp pilus assembly protein PilX